jgi:hypothetical protein
MPASIVNLTRPNNTTAYTAGDAVGDTSGSAILVFPDIGSTSRQICITNAVLMINIAAIPASMTTHTLEFYTDAPNAIVDNAVWDLSSAGDRVKYLDSIQFAALTDKGSTLVSSKDTTKYFTLTNNNLYAVLRTDAGYTPSEVSTVYKIILNSYPVRY